MNVYMYQLLNSMIKYIYFKTWYTELNILILLLSNKQLLIEYWNLKNSFNIL